MCLAQNNNSKDKQRTPCNGLAFKCEGPKHYRACSEVARINNQTITALDNKIRSCAAGRVCNEKQKKPCVLRDAKKKPNAKPHKGHKGNKNKNKPHNSNSGKPQNDQNRPQQQYRPQNQNGIKPHQNSVQNKPTWIQAGNDEEHEIDEEESEEEDTPSGGVVVPSSILSGISNIGGGDHHGGHKPDEHEDHHHHHHAGGDHITASNELPGETIIPDTELIDPNSIGDDDGHGPDDHEHEAEIPGDDGWTDDGHGELNFNEKLAY